MNTNESVAVVTDIFIILPIAIPIILIWFNYEKGVESQSDCDELEKEIESNEKSFDNLEMQQLPSKTMSLSSIFESNTPHSPHSPHSPHKDENDEESEFWVP